MPRVSVNGTELYHEIRGTGPPVLLIMGATGDGGHFDALADVLADEFMVVTYDRRGNGRSPAPPGWQTTSPQEQADDAAGLLTALGIGPVAVFGTSSGGNFTLCLLIRHPGWVRGAILHEPGLYALVDDFDAVRAPVRALVQEAMAAGGPPAAVERFWCYVAGERAGTGWSPRFARACAPPPAPCSRSSSGPTSCTCPAMRRWPPLPCRCSCWSARTAFRSGPRSRAGSPGAWVWMSPPRQAHDAYHEYPAEFADAVRPFLREVSGART